MEEKVADIMAWLAIMAASVAMTKIGQNKISVKILVYHVSSSIVKFKTLTNVQKENKWEE